MRIAHDLYVVGGGDGGFNLTGVLDANCYVVDTGEGLWLIDVGLDDIDRVLANIAADGLDPSAIASVFVTHHHADHAGALAALSERVPQAEVSIGAEVADAVRHADEIDNGLAYARAAGYYPQEFRLAPARVDVELTDGMTMERGSFRLTAVATPGHGAGHFCFLVHGDRQRLLFSGDQVFCGGQIALQNLPDVSIAACSGSMLRLLDLEFDSLLPGHGRFAVERGRTHVESAAATFQAMGLPRNLF
jgi:glyoxylase-like metal-dependent hydrolase (beta-lactamase superfamily II)